MKNLKTKNEKSKTHRWCPTMCKVKNQKNETSKNKNEKSKN